MDHPRCPHRPLVEAGCSVSASHWQPYSASPAPAAPAAPAAAREGAAGAPDALDDLLAALDAHGDEALRLARAELVAMERPADMGTNALSWLGGRVSWHLRRAVLLHELTVAGWNLTVAAEKLRLGGPGNVVRLIRELDLRDEQKAAQRAGLGRVGGARFAHERTKGSK